MTLSWDFLPDPSPRLGDKKENSRSGSSQVTLFWDVVHTSLEMFLDPIKISF